MFAGRSDLGRRSTQIRRRAVAWSGVDQWRAELCWFTFGPDGLEAQGTQIGVEPMPYRMDYSLDATDGYRTRRLEVSVTMAESSRRLELLADGSGNWTSTTDSAGESDLPPPGGDLSAVSGAIDCDLGLCPATNSMPVVRHGLHRGPGAHDFLMAWVSVPDLGVHPSRQRYEHVRLTPDGSVVRYVGEHRSFVVELEMDADGVVMFYPDLARRVDP